MKHFDPFMKKAWIILLVIGFALSIIFPTNAPEPGSTFLIAGLIWCAIYNALVIFLLNKSSTEDGLLKSKKPITIWGYIWRTSVINYISLIPAMLATLVIAGAPPYTSILTFMLIYALHALASIIAVWCIFSKDRKSQIGWLLSLGRGY